jgi:hypothetical protein
MMRGGTDGFGGTFQGVASDRRCRPLTRRWCRDRRALPTEPVVAVLGLISFGSLTVVLAVDELVVVELSPRLVMWTSTEIQGWVSVLIHQSSAGVEDQRQSHSFAPEITGRIGGPALCKGTVAGRSGHARIGPLAGIGPAGTAGHRDGDLRTAGPQLSLRTRTQGQHRGLRTARRAMVPSPRHPTGGRVPHHTPPLPRLPVAPDRLAHQVPEHQATHHAVHPGHLDSPRGSSPRVTIVLSSPDIGDRGVVKRG